MDWQSDGGGGVGGVAGDSGPTICHWKFKEYQCVCGGSAVRGYVQNTHDSEHEWTAADDNNDDNDDDDE